MTTGEPKSPPAKTGFGDNEEKILHKDSIRDVRHVKAARELLRWNQARLAEEAGLSIASVRRYEAARGALAASIEDGILGALSRAGVVFVADERVKNVQFALGVLIKTSAQPDEPAPKRTYAFPKKEPGRPAGLREAKPRKKRAGTI